MNSPSGRRPTRERTWSRKFADAARGLGRALRSQSSFAVHLPAAIVVIAAAGLLGVSVVEWCALAAAVGGVLAAEVFNTAIESLARAVDSRPHPRIRDALDMASAAVLVAAATAAAIGLAVFGRRVGGLLGLW